MWQTEELIIIEKKKRGCGGVSSSTRHPALAQWTEQNKRTVARVCLLLQCTATAACICCRDVSLDVAEPSFGLSNMCRALATDTSQVKAPISHRLMPPTTNWAPRGNGRKTELAVLLRTMGRPPIVD